MKKLLKTTLYVILAPVLLFAIFLLYSTLADYKPAPVESLAKTDGTVINVYDTLKVFDWNIGYSGLGDDMSFFYDGGDKMRTTRERTEENLKGISTQLTSHDSIAFYLLQEVDKKSHRSYKLNEFDTLTNNLPGYYGYYAMNYKVAFIPAPPSNPMGKVDGGLASYSKFVPFAVDRYSFEGNYAWPKGLFLLDRCFMVQRFYTSDGKELLVINTHNSAYDDGTLRKRQMEMMRTFLLEEYKNGNYILVGGDWNQNPPKQGKSADESKDSHLTRLRIASDFMPANWQWVYSEDIPTNRMIDEAYNPESTVTTVIDFFLASPNLKIISQQNLNLNFKNSDHHPVLLSFAFNY
jgi:endonuclease/exonuclease/phosphatase family metal-dependent hydrolase